VTSIVDGSKVKRFASTSMMRGSGSCRAEPAGEASRRTAQQHEKVTQRVI
jgi:hypothetical protein